MRNRLLLLLVFASLLGTPVLVHWLNRQQKCANITDAALCRAADPDPVWVFPLGLLSAVSLAAAGLLYVRALSARHQEKDLLDNAGVHIPEQELPLDD